MLIDELFQTLTTFSPHQFQRQTIARLLNRQDVLLRAPTGAGKTETAIAPFLFAKALNQDFPYKLIYVVPLRTLANSLRQRAEILVERWATLYPSPRPIVVTIQTGENPEDPRFEGDIVFCTIDQMLSSFLNIPYSVGRGSANVNAGAMFASYLVFDELHLLDPDRAFATVLKVLEQVKGITPFLLMTATLTDELAAQIQQIASASPMEIISVEDADLQKIAAERRRTFKAIETPLTAEVILTDIQTHQRRRVIVLCNTVYQAQGLLQDLEQLSQNGITLTLLHSRFLPGDRAVKEAELKTIFAQNWQEYADNQCHVLISTQAIEAGINITCEVMHTHLCPMNSLLQRAGRVARFPNESGEVYIYRSIQVTQADFETDVEIEAPSVHKQNFLPYSNEICELTWQVLQQHTTAQVIQNVGFRTEEQWINQVHQQEDKLQQQRRLNNQMHFDQRFEDAFFRGDQSAATELIRSVDNRSLFIWEDSPLIDFEQEIDPKKLLAFSVPISALCKVWREFQLGYETDWIFKQIEAPTRTETYLQPTCTPITSRAMLVSSIRILVNPRYVRYDDKIGLLIGVHAEGNKFTSPPKLKQAIANEYQYHMDTYIGHLVLMWKCWREPFRTNILKNDGVVEINYTSVRDELLLAGGRFIQAKIFPQVELETTTALFEILVFFAVFCHDLGKLQVKWQSAMRGWQTIAYNKFQRHPRSHPKDYLLAHTDYNPSDPAQKAELKQYEQKHQRPNHAIESAFLAWDILNESLYPLLEGTFNADTEQIDNFIHIITMATGRHHSAWAKGWQPSDLARLKQIELHPAARKAITQSWHYLMRFLPPTLPLQSSNLSHDTYRTQTLELNIFGNDQLEYQQLYTLVVRALRLCDQRSVQLSQY